MLVLVLVLVLVLDASALRASEATFENLAASTTGDLGHPVGGPSHFKWCVTTRGTAEAFAAAVENLVENVLPHDQRFFVQAFDFLPI